MTTPVTQPIINEPIPASVCAQMVESATRSCQPLIEVPPEPVNSTADSLAALSAAFTFGSILLAMIALFGAIGWGFLVKIWSEREAREEAKRCTEKWLAEEAIPMLRREMQEWKKTFSQDAPISDADVDKLVTAAGADGKEDDDGQK